MSTTLSPDEAAWQEPTAYDAFIDGATGRVPGTHTFPGRPAVFTAVLAVVAAVIFPNLRDGALPYVSGTISLLVLLPIVAVRVGRVQFRFGRSRSHVMAAWYGSVAVTAVFLLLFVAANLLVGQPTLEAPFYRALEALMGNDLSRAVGVFLAFLLAIPILLLVLASTYGRRKRAEVEAAIEAASQREKDARARAHERSLS